MKKKQIALVLLVLSVLLLIGVGGTVLKAWLYGQFIGGCPA